MAVLLVRPGASRCIGVCCGGACGPLWRLADHCGTAGDVIVAPAGALWYLVVLLRRCLLHLLLAVICGFATAVLVVFSGTSGCYCGGAGGAFLSLVVT